MGEEHEAFIPIHPLRTVLHNRFGNALLPFPVSNALLHLRICNIPQRGARNVNS